MSDITEEQEGLMSLDDRFAEVEAAFSNDEIVGGNPDNLSLHDAGDWRRDEDVGEPSSEPIEIALETVRFTLVDVKKLLLVENWQGASPTGVFEAPVPGRKTVDNVDEAKYIDVPSEPRAEDYAETLVEDWLTPTMVENAAYLINYAKSILPKGKAGAWRGTFKRFDRVLKLKARQVGLAATRLKNPKFKQLRGYAFEEYDENRGFERTVYAAPPKESKPTKSSIIIDDDWNPYNL